ncbi:hypothetical protein C8R47DRAFT_418403 [Mycena vitilis]|nr:hypothetical protein C8R47DRAFT_418403 [Mycena vitilis]
MGSTVYNLPATFKHHSDTSATCPPRAHLDTAALRTAKKVFRVPKYKTVQDIADVVADDESRNAELGSGGVDLTHADTYSMSGKGKERETTPDPDVRSAKRRKVAHDFAFLQTSLPHSIQPDISPSTSGFAVPSSDLLKCIHHFACNYYSDRGQLFNASRTYRKAKKQRRLAKLAAKEQQTSVEDGANSGEEEGPDASTDPPQTTHLDRRRDMYKTMDGSALLAIGMLLQEHIARVLTARIPDGWEQGELDGYEDGGEDDETSGGHDLEEEGEDEDTGEVDDEDEDEGGGEDEDEDEDADEDGDGKGAGAGDLDEAKDPDEDGEDPGSEDPDEWGPRDDRSESDEEDSE